MEETAPILEIVHINKNFGGIMALMDVSFDVAPGTVTALIGPNGAGKTTLLNVISGIYLASAGEVLFEGSRISSIRTHEATYLGIARTFQNLQLFHNMSVIENVMVGLHSTTSSKFMACLARTLKVRREEKRVSEKARELLSFVNLAGKEDFPPSALPGGEQKRLELARALVSGPKMILLDEPVSGLNARETDEMADIILRLKKLGMTVLLVEHDMNLVMRIADRIVVLNYGQKLAEGLPEDIQNDAKVIAAYLGND